MTDFFELFCAVNTANSAPSGSTSQLQTTFVPGSNQSRMRIYSQGGQFNLKGYSVSMRNAYLKYCFPSLLVRSSLSYIWIDSNTYTLSLPANSTWTAAQLNVALQQVQIANKNYLINAQNVPVFYISVAQNSTVYSVEVDLTQLPSTLPVGWTMPPGATWALGSTDTPQFIVPDVNIGGVIGFPVGTYPAIATVPSVGTVISYWSLMFNMCPQVTPYNCIFVNSSVVNNTANSINGVNCIYTMPINSAYGQPLVSDVYNPQPIKCSQLQTQYIDVFLTDGNGVPLVVLDPFWQVILHFQKDMDTKI